MASTSADDSSSEPPKNTYFECNVCLDVAKDPVVSLVGYIFNSAGVILTVLLTVWTSFLLAMYPSMD